MESEHYRHVETTGTTWTTRQNDAPCKRRIYREGSDSKEEDAEQCRQLRRLRQVTAIGFWRRSPGHKSAFFQGHTRHSFGRANLKWPFPRPLTPQTRTNTRRPSQPGTRRPTVGTRAPPPRRDLRREFDDETGRRAESILTTYSPRGLGQQTSRPLAVPRNTSDSAVIHADASPWDRVSRPKESSRTGAARPVIPEVERKATQFRGRTSYHKTILLLGTTTTVLNPQITYLSWTFLVGRPRVATYLSGHTRPTNPHPTICTHN